MARTVLLNVNKNLSFVSGSIFSSISSSTLFNKVKYALYDMWGFNLETRSGNGFAKVENTIIASSCPVSMIFSIKVETDSGFSTRSFLNSLTFRLTGALSIADKDIFLKLLLSIISSSSSSSSFPLLPRIIKKRVNPKSTKSINQSHHCFR